MNKSNYKINKINNNQRIILNNKMIYYNKITNNKLKNSNKFNKFNKFNKIKKVYFKQN